MATHSSINAWRIPWTEEPGRLQSMGSQELDNLVTKSTPPLLHFVLQGQICLLLRVSLDFLLLHSSPLMKWTSFLGVSSKRSCRSSQNHSTSASSVLLLVGAQTWITVILNGLPWKQTEIILSFLRLHPFWTLVDYDGYSISSKGFLPTVGDIMVI